MMNIIQRLERLEAAHADSDARKSILQMKRTVI